VEVELPLAVEGVVRERLVEQEGIVGNAVGDLLPEPVWNAPRDVGAEAVDDGGPLVDNV